MDSETTVLVAVSNLVTSAATALVTYRKTRADAKSAEDQAFAAKYDALFDELHRHKTELKAEINEGRTALNVLRLEHEKCTSSNRRLTRVILKIQDQILKLQGLDKAMSARQKQDLIEIIDGIDADVASKDARDEAEV